MSTRTPTIRHRYPMDGSLTTHRKDVVKWHEEMGKPYGVYGITLPMQASASAACATPNTGR
ncbi:MAG: hypothetical protein ACKOEM_02450 [Planctomycetia bacterium]